MLLVDAHTPVYVVKCVDLHGNDKHKVRGRARESGGVSGLENPGELSCGAGVLFFNFVTFFLFAA